MFYVLVMYLFLHGEMVNKGVSGPIPDLDTCHAVQARELAQIHEADKEYVVHSNCLLWPTET